MILESALKAVFEESLKLKQNEKCLIVTDIEKERIANSFYHYAQKICEDVSVRLIELTGQSGKEPDEETAQMMKDADVALLITKYSLSHTNSRRKACASGTRIVSMPGITYEVVNRCVDIDYNELYKINAKLRERLIGSSKIHVTTKLGTDIKLGVTEVHGENGGYRDKPGMWGNLPAGEVDSGVKSFVTNGTIVVDGSFPGMKLAKPITIRIKNGYAVSIEGDDDKLKSQLDAVGPDAYKIAEFGIGTNKKAIITGVVLEDEKVMGTCHFALGNDLSYGGENDVPIHLDGVIKNPTIVVDDEIIIEEGIFLI